MEGENIFQGSGFGRILGLGGDSFRPGNKQCHLKQVPRQPFPRSSHVTSRIPPQPAKSTEGNNNRPSPSKNQSCRASENTGARNFGAGPVDLAEGVHRLEVKVPVQQPRSHPRLGQAASRPQHPRPNNTPPLAPRTFTIMVPNQQRRILEINRSRRSRTPLLGTEILQTIY